MTHTYPLTVGYNESIRSKENPLSFANLRLVDLRNGQSQYLSTMKQLVDTLTKTVDPASRFALRGHIARPGQPRLRHSMRAAMWFLLPSDVIFRRSSISFQYYLTPQGRRVVSRGDDVTGHPLDRRLNWIPDPTPSPPRDHGKENHPPSSQPPKLPRKMRPRRKKRGHHQQHLPGGAPATDPRPQERMWTSGSIPSLPRIRSIPVQQPMRIRPVLISRTRLTTAGFISGHHQTGSRNPQNDLVETTSLGHLPPSALSGRIETISLDRPIGQ